jgi:hypothetical protein
MWRLKLIVVTDTLAVPSEPVAEALKPLGLLALSGDLRLRACHWRLQVSSRIDLMEY